MLTVKLQDLELSPHATYVAHVVRIESVLSGDRYFVGMSHGTGKPIGFLTAATGQTLRSWKSFSGVETSFGAIQDRLVAITLMVNTSCASDMAEMLIRHYELEVPHPHPVVETERRALLEVLTQHRQESVF